MNVATIMMQQKLHVTYFRRFGKEGSFLLDNLVGVLCIPTEKAVNLFLFQSHLQRGYFLVSLPLKKNELSAKVFVYCVYLFHPLFQMVFE